MTLYFVVVVVFYAPNISWNAEFAVLLCDVGWAADDLVLSLFLLAAFFAAGFLPGREPELAAFHISSQSLL